MTGHFNEDFYSNKMQDFLTETGLFDVFEEMSGVQKQCRNPTVKCRIECACFRLATKGF